MMIKGKIPETGYLVDMFIENGKVSRVESCQEESRCESGKTHDYLCPGFFDPQVNGFAGVDFNSPHLTPEELHQAACSLALTGVTQFFPTLITSAHVRTLHQLKMITQAIKRDSLLRQMCLGIHLEGPYLSPEEGARGIHPLEFIRPPHWEELERFQEACEGWIRCITLAPEVEGAIPFIEKAVAKGIVIGIGHTSASENVIEEAVRAGARLSSHLGNAPSALSPHHQNTIQKQLAMEQLMVSIIVDGIHLSPDLVRNYIQIKGNDRIILMTDSMAGAGSSPGRYTIGDIKVEVGSNGVAHLMKQSRLAGSTLTMNQAISNVIRFSGVDLPSAIRMAARNAQKLFPDVKTEIILGNSANFVLFKYQKELVVQSTWIEGEKIF